MPVWNLKIRVEQIGRLDRMESMGHSKIVSLIHLIRGRHVMLDSDIAKLYGVTTGNLNKAVGRNSARFPEDFMFKLSEAEARNLRFQTGSLRWGAHPKYLPHVFTQEGVAMLSGVLRSEAAVRVNIGIMRAFVSLRRALAAGAQASRLKSIERKVDAHELELGEHEARLNEVFAAMRRGKRRRIS